MDEVLYRSVASRLAGPELSRPVRPAVPDGHAETPQFLRQCCLYFDGRVDAPNGLSSHALGKLARLHGARVSLRACRGPGGVTHVVCTRLAAAKERQALVGNASSGAASLYFVAPAWLTASVAAGRRLPERRFPVPGLGGPDVGLRDARSAPLTFSTASPLPAVPAGSASPCGPPHVAVGEVAVASCPSAASPSPSATLPLATSPLARSPGTRSARRPSRRWKKLARSPSACSPAASTAAQQMAVSVESSPAAASPAATDLDTDVDER